MYLSIWESRVIKYQTVFCKNNSKSLFVWRLLGLKLYSIFCDVLYNSRKLLIKFSALHFSWEEVINHVDDPGRVLDSFGKVSKESVVAYHHFVFVTFVFCEVYEVEIRSSLPFILHLVHPTKNMEDYGYLYVTSLWGWLEAWLNISCCNRVFKIVC